MLLYVYYTKKDEVPCVEYKGVARVDGGVDACSIVYRYFLNLVLQKIEAYHLGVNSEDVKEVLSMSTVPDRGQDVDETFDELDISILRYLEA